MIDSTTLHSLLLERINGAAGKRMSGSKFKLFDADQKRLGVSVDDERKAIDELVASGYLSKTMRGSFSLTQAGQAYLESLKPDQPELNPRLYPYQKSYVLLQFFKEKHAGNKSSTGWLTRAKLEKKLNTTDGRGYLLLYVQDPAESDKFHPDSPLLDWLLHSLERDKALDKRRKGGVLTYGLTDLGEELFWANDQYPSARVEFKLKGESFNRMVRVIRESTSMTRKTDQSAPESEPAASATNGTSAIPVVASAPVQSEEPLTPDIVLREFTRLRREEFPRDDMAPIHTLRARIAKSFGEHAAAHSVLDPLIKQLARERRIRLISIGDRSRATPEQLDASIQGQSETFFYIEAAHEHATIG